MSEIRAYLLDPVKYPPARLRWEEARETCQDWHDRYEETRQMTNNIKTAEGVIEAGPDEPALAAATQREETARRVAMNTLASTGPVGDVAPSQAGILPYKIDGSRIAVTEAMFERAWAKAMELELDVEGSDVRAILQAGLTGVA